MENTEVAALVALINKLAEKFPEATIEHYTVGIKTELGTLNFYGAAPSHAALVPAPSGEAQLAATTAKKGRAARTSPSETSQSGASKDATKATAAASGANSTGSATDSSSADEDLFGEKAAPAPAEKPKATIEMLRKALTECQTKHGHKDHALGVLKKHTRDGNPTISTLDESKYQDVIDACAKYVPAK